MAIKVLFFAQSADWAGCREKSIAGSVGTVKEILESDRDFAPVLSHLAHLRVAVNQEFSDFNTEVKDGDEVAFIPPVSGG